MSAHRMKIDTTVTTGDKRNDGFLNIKRATKVDNMKRKKMLLRSSRGQNFCALIHIEFNHLASGPTECIVPQKLIKALVLYIQGACDDLK